MGPGVDMAPNATAIFLMFNNYEGYVMLVPVQPGHEPRAQVMTAMRGIAAEENFTTRKDITSTRPNSKI